MSVFILISSIESRMNTFERRQSIAIFIFSLNIIYEMC